MDFDEFLDNVDLSEEQKKAFKDLYGLYFCFRCFASVLPVFSTMFDSPVPASRGSKDDF